MTISAQRRDSAPPIPVIQCPQCRKAMRLATVEPTSRDDLGRMTFDCECGFEYRLSESAAHEAASH